MHVIAVIDDNDAVRASLGRLLSTLGYSTTLFASADAFLASQRIGETSCIITDVQMPGSSGLELQKRLLAQEYRIPIIFITGFPHEVARSRAMKAGATAFLHKPFKPDELALVLEKALTAY